MLYSVLDRSLELGTCLITSCLLACLLEYLNENTHRTLTQIAAEPG